MLKVDLTKLSDMLVMKVIVLERVHHYAQI